MDRVAQRLHVSPTRRKYHPIASKYLNTQVPTCKEAFCCARALEALTQSGSQAGTFYGNMTVAWVTAFSLRRML
eukprot:3812133-Amphidinium_carterae.1